MFVTQGLFHTWVVNLPLLGASPRMIPSHPKTLNLKPQTLNPNTHQDPEIAERERERERDIYIYIYIYIYNIYIYALGSGATPPPPNGIPPPPPWPHPRHSPKSVLLRTDLPLLRIGAKRNLLQ